MAFVLPTPITAHLVTGGTDVYTCPTGKAARVFNLQVSNVDGTNDAEVSISHYDASKTDSFFLVKTVTVPADAALRPLGDDGSKWLEAGDKINAAASADSDLDLTGDVIEYDAPAA